MAGREKQLWSEDSCRDTWAEPSALGSGPLGIPREKSPGGLLDVGPNPGPASCQHKPHVCRITVLRDTGPQRLLHGKARGQERQESQHMTSSSWMSATHKNSSGKERAMSKPLLPASSPTGSFLCLISANSPWNPREAAPSPHPWPPTGEQMPIVPPVNARFPPPVTAWPHQSLVNSAVPSLGHTGLALGHHRCLSAPLLKWRVPSRLFPSTPPPAPSQGFWRVS